MRSKKENAIKVLDSWTLAEGGETRHSKEERNLGEFAFGGSSIASPFARGAAQSILSHYC